MFTTKEVLSVSAAAHRINEGFIKKDQVRFDEKHKNFYAPTESELN